MTINFELNKGTVILGTALAGALTYIGISNHKKSKDTKKKIDNVIKNLADATEVQVSDYILQEAAKKAAKDACADAMHKVREDFDSQIRSCVRDTYSAEGKVLAEKIKAEIEKDGRLEQMVVNAEQKASEEAYKDILKKMEKYNESVLRKFEQANNSIGVVFKA